MIKRPRRLLVAALAGLWTVPLSAQEPEPAETVAADVISAILNGTADDAAWDDLATALDQTPADIAFAEGPLAAVSPGGVDGVDGAPPAESDSQTPVSFGDRARAGIGALGRGFSAATASVLGSPDAVVGAGILLFLLIATVTTVLGVSRRRRRPALAVASQRTRSPLRGRSRSRPRRGRGARHSRDAERLAARLRARRAA